MKFNGDLQAKYSEKELRILDGIRELMRKGVDLQMLRTGDIVKATGIAKGTLYLYFPSKTEMLIATVIYIVESQICEAKLAIDEADTFHDKCMAVFRCLEKWTQNHESSFHILLSLNGTIKFEAIQEQAKAWLEEIKNTLVAIIDDAVRIGIEEGVIGSGYDELYIWQVIVSAVRGFENVYSFGSFKDGNPDPAENAYSIIVTALR